MENIYYFYNNNNNNNNNNNLKVLRNLFSSSSVDLQRYLFTSFQMSVAFDLCLLMCTHVYTSNCDHQEFFSPTPAPPLLLIQFLKLLGAMSYECRAIFWMFSLDFYFLTWRNVCQPVHVRKYTPNKFNTQNRKPETLNREILVNKFGSTQYILLRVSFQQKSLNYKLAFS
jgi:hypothetical protein